MIVRIRDHERLSLSLLAFLAVFFLTAFLRPILGDADSWWHLAAGKWILANQQVPTVDPFSHSRPGAPWHAQEWLSEVAMWMTYANWGWEGLIGLAALLAGAAAAIFCYHVRRFLPPVAAIALTVLVALCLMPSAWVRPHMMVLPILLLWLIRLLAAREEGRAPPLPLAALMILWANMHASFLLGLVMIVPLALEAVAEPGDRRSAMIGWGFFALVSLAASLVTPFGIEGLVYPLQVSAMETLHSIVEWKPPTLADSPYFFLLLFGLLLAFILLGVRFRPLRALLFLLFLYMAFSHRRHIFVFAFLGSLLAAEPLGRALPKREEPKREESALDRGFALMMAASVLILLAARILIPASAGPGHSQPLAAIAAVPPELRTKAVFNHYNFGGPLIFSGIRPFIDGRADMYGDAFVKDYIAAEGADPAVQARLFRDYGIRWTILPPRSPLVPYLAARGWRRVYADDRAVVQANPAFRRTNPTEVRRIAALPKILS
ncbi:hypothetical protein [Allosphingosinicella humi]